MLSVRRILAWGGEADVVCSQRRWEFAIPPRSRLPIRGRLSLANVCSRLVHAAPPARSSTNLMHSGRRVDCRSQQARIFRATARQYDTADEQPPRQFLTAAMKHSRRLRTSTVGKWPLSRPSPPPPSNEKAASSFQQLHWQWPVDKGKQAPCYVHYQCHRFGVC